MTESDRNAQWLAAVQEMQRQTAEAHMHFQRVLADSHQAFLQMAENTFAAFTGQPPPLTQKTPPLVPMPPAPVAMPPAPQSQAVPHRSLNRRPRHSTIPTQRHRSPLRPPSQ